MLLSIIIPAYNVADFIELCLKSVVSQDISNTEYEIIIINDGSEDDTLDRIQRFVTGHRDYNFHVIDQKNMGLSMARNNGLELAKGEYIWFIDSDDWIVGNSLGYIKRNISSGDYEMIALTTNIQEKSCVQIIDRRLHSCSYIPGECLYKKGWVYPYSGAQFYIFKKSFMDEMNLRFTQGIVHEDLLFTPNALRYASRCLILESPVYNYRIRENSITTTITSFKHLDSLFFIMNEYILMFRNDGHWISADMVGRIFINLLYRMSHINNPALKDYLMSKIRCLPNLMTVVLKSRRVKNVVAYIYVSCVSMVYRKRKDDDNA